MLGKFISQTPAEYNSCKHLWNLFTLKRIVGWDYKGLTRAPVSNKSTPPFCGKNFPFAMNFHVRIGEISLSNQPAYPPTAARAQLTITYYYMWLPASSAPTIVLL
jgi:hypothetical protein